jgi:hypothetical protein
MDAPDGESLRVEKFSRDEAYPLEWANIFAGPARLLDDAPGYVFEELARRLPLPGAVLELAEVDTPADLAHARSFSRAIRS